eukprot:3871467-Pyramimonas_sp.AAC.2
MDSGVCEFTLRAVSSHSGGWRFASIVEYGLFDVRHKGLIYLPASARWVGLELTGRLFLPKT